MSLAVLAALMGSACGGDPPDKELQQAQSAIDTARAGEAERYAKDEFTAAEDALKKAKAAVVDRDYRQALNNALDARQRAQNATKEAAERKASTKSGAERALADATAALADATARLKSADAVHAAGRSVTVVDDTPSADGDAGVQKARTAFAAGDYLSVQIDTARAS